MSKDPLVASAISNWFPRFVANGVDINDFHNTTDRVSTWSEWFDEWYKTALVHSNLGEQAEARGFYVSAGKHYFSAAINCHFGKFLFVHDRNKLLEGTQKTVEFYQKAARYFKQPSTRLEIPFQSGMITGNYRRASQLPSGLVLLIPGLDSVKEEMFTYEELLLERGLSTLAIDGPGQGETEFSFAIYPHYEAVVTAVIDYLLQQYAPEFTSLGIAGVSLGGYYVCRAAAGDERIKACVDVSGPFDLGECWDNLPGLTKQAFRVRSYLDNLEQACERAKELTLEGCINKIKCPLLVIHGEKDRLFPLEQAQRIYTGAQGEKELLSLQNGNHVCNNLPYMYKYYLADWLRKTLLLP